MKGAKGVVIYDSAARTLLGHIRYICDANEDSSLNRSHRSKRIASLRVVCVTAAVSTGIIAAASLPPPSLPSP